MINKTIGESYVPNQTQHVDWTAFEFLQEKRKSLLKRELQSNTYFKLDAIEYALDRALEKPNRLATGEKLAKDLFRDGKRVVATQLARTVQSKARREDYEYLQEKEDRQIELEDRNFEKAIILVKSSFQAMPKKEALALYLFTVGLTSEAEIKEFLNVSSRQYRNLLNQSKSKLNQLHGFREAFMLIHLQSEDEDIREFFSGLINQMFNYQLS